MTIAVLALQGAFAEHEKVLDRLGVSHIELRQASDLDQPFDALILPGGESTVQSKLLKELEMFEPLKKRIENGMPVLATCAGLILLASEIEGQDSCHLSVRLMYLTFMRIQRYWHLSKTGSLAYSTKISWLLPFIRNWMKTPGSIKNFWRSSGIPVTENPGTQSILLCVPGSSDIF